MSIGMVIRPVLFCFMFTIPIALIANFFMEQYGIWHGAIILILMGIVYYLVLENILNWTTGKINHLIQGRMLDMATRNLTEEVMIECEKACAANNGKCDKENCKVSSACAEVLRKVGLIIKLTDVNRTDAVLRELPRRTKAKEPRDE